MQLARLLVTATLAAAVIAPAAARPAAAQAAAALPAASEITARHVKLVGGRDALARISSIEMRGTMEMPAMGLKADIVSFARANRSANRMSIPGIGEIVTGFDGETAWEVSPMQGPRLLAGAELTAARDDADISAMGYPAAAFKTLETVELLDFEGQKAYRVRAVRASGRETSEFFGVDSGLLIGRSERRESPMGTMTLTTVMSDYKPFGAIRLPTHHVQKVDQQQMVMTFTSITLDAVPDSAFAMPDAIRALKK